VLEYGSGLASKAFLLADHGAASVAGIDISPVAVEAGNERARYLYRRRIPELRAPDEHPLLMGDLDLLEPTRSAARDLSTSGSRARRS
jgi:SAM-dependent methyltransferase